MTQTLEVRNYTSLNAHLLMIKLFPILFLSFLFSGELEVNGDLKVTGAINSPSIDALSGMTPTRIYNYQCSSSPDCSTFYFTVPEGKAWRVIANGQSEAWSNLFVKINVEYQETLLFNNSELWLFQGQYLSGNHPTLSRGFYTIFEYPMTSTGTSQGMNYVEP